MKITKKNKLIILLISILLLLIVVYIYFKPESENTLKIEKILVSNSLQLDSVFTNKNYCIDTIFKDSIVPKIFVENVPYDLKKLNKKLKKEVFIRILLSNILKLNEEILKERDQIVKYINAKTKENGIAANKIANKYKSDTLNVIELLKRVDVIPPSLVIAQAITESGWGTSRFSIEGNALFGHHSTKGDTSKFIKSKKDRVKHKAFNTVYEAVKAYMCNLNTSKSYKFLRKERAIIRSKNEMLKGKKLTKHLGRYSERGILYVNSLNSMIRAQRLEKYDYLKLDSSKYEIYISILKNNKKALKK